MESGWQVITLHPSEYSCPETHIPTLTQHCHALCRHTQTLHPHLAMRGALVVALNMERRPPNLQAEGRLVCELCSCTAWIPLAAVLGLLRWVNQRRVSHGEVFRTHHSPDVISAVKGAGEAGDSAVWK